jgi:hypothetical protein
LSTAQLRDSRLELPDLFSRVVGVVAQRRGLPGLREIEQDEDGQPDDRGKACIRPHRVDEVVDGESEWNRLHAVR